MNVFVSVLVIGFFIFMIIMNVSNIRKIVISTKKGILEVILYILIMVVFCVLAAVLADRTIHYVIGGVGIGFVITEFFKQGIFNGGVMFVKRWKEVYSWDEILKAEIRKGKVIKVTYFGKYDLMITHKYSLDKYKDIVDMFISNGVEYTIIYN